MRFGGWLKAGYIVRYIRKKLASLVGNIRICLDIAVNCWETSMNNPTSKRILWAMLVWTSHHALWVVLCDTFSKRNNLEILDQPDISENTNLTVFFVRKGFRIQPEGQQGTTYHWKYGCSDFLGTQTLFHRFLMPRFGLLSRGRCSKKGLRDFSIIIL